MKINENQWHRRLECVRRYGGDLKQRSSHGRSALELAQQCNIGGSHEEVLILLAEPVTFCNLRSAMQLMSKKSL